MGEAPVELWVIIAGFAGAFVLAMLSVLARVIAYDDQTRRLRNEVTNLRIEYARRTSEVQVVEAEEERLDGILEVEGAPEQKKAA